MNRLTIRLIAFSGSLLICSLVVIQVFWVRKAYETQKKQFDYDVKSSLTEVYFEIFRHSNDSTPLVEPVQSIREDYYTVSTNDTLHPYYLETLLRNAFLKRHIPLDFEYGIYDCFTDSIVYSKYITGSNRTGDPPMRKVLWDRDGHYFSVYFPSYGKMLFSNMRFWIFSTMVILLFILFLALVLIMLFRQKRLSEIKTDFINNMTHELKTPISSIALSADVLTREEVLHHPEKLKKYATIIKRENHRLQKQVERVLQMASLEKNAYEMSLEKVPIHKIISHLANIYMEVSLSEGKGRVTLDFLADNDVVLGDEMHLSNIFNNLIDNAIKYCEGLPELRITTENKEGKLYISFSDNGIGIPPDQHKIIFDRFYRIPTGNLHNVKGFGIGLYYVKRMVEKHGGRISVKKNSEKGSTFTIQLPQ